MKRAGEVLPFTISSIGIRKKFEEKLIVYHWREIVGPDIYAHARAVSLQRSVLLVAVDNSVWCHHLAVSKTDILDKLNAFAGEKLVSDIRFKAGNLKDYQNYENDIPQNDVSAKSRLPKLSEEETKQAEKRTSHVHNLALRQKITRILKKDAALKKAKQAAEWHTCQNCSVLCPPDEQLCPACGLEAKKTRIAKLRAIMLEVPWVTFGEIQVFIECSKGEYIVCKQDLQEYFAEQVRNNKDDNLPLMSYIMLKQGLKPEQITDDIVEYTIQSLRRKKYVFTPGS